MKTRIRIATVMFVFLGLCTAISLPPAAIPQHSQDSQFSGGGSPTPCPPPPTGVSHQSRQDIPTCP